MYNQGLKFRVVPPSTGGTYRSVSLPVRGPSATTKNRPSTVDFGHRRPIEGESTIGDRLREIGGRRSIEGDRRSEKKGRRGKEEEEKQNLYRRPRPVAAHRSPARRHRPHQQAIFLPRRRQNVSPCGEKDQGD
ncbi:hypothetical protein BHE74_00040785, partial [Ensete ventricosum]